MWENSRYCRMCGAMYSVSFKAICVQQSIGCLCTLSGCLERTPTGMRCPVYWSSLSKYRHLMMCMTVEKEVVLRLWQGSGRKMEAVPRVELGSPDSESGVITTTLHSRNVLPERFSWCIYIFITTRLLSLARSQAGIPTEQYSHIRSAGSCCCKRLEGSVLACALANAGGGCIPGAIYKCASVPTLPYLQMSMIKSGKKVLHAVYAGSLQCIGFHGHHMATKHEPHLYQKLSFLVRG